jgi:AraC-like DNA-binding protein
MIGCKKMAGDVPASAIMRVSTEMFSEKERFSAFREEYVRQRLAMDMIDRSGGCPRMEASVMPLGPVDFISFDMTPAEFIREKRHLKGARGDTFTLVVVRSGRFHFEQAGGGHISESGAGAFCDQGRQWQAMGLGNTSLRKVTVGAAALRALVRDPEDLAARPLNPGPLLRLLDGYLGALSALHEAPPPELAPVIGGHLLDLVAAALGPCRDTAQMIERRGVRAARLRAVLDVISRRFADPGFDLGSVARATRLSRRYVQDLLEDTGNSFTEHVLERRLTHALTLLTDPRSNRALVTDIAFTSGFGDLSHFNRVFRRRYGDTPTSVRARAVEPDSVSIAAAQSVTSRAFQDATIGARPERGAPERRIDPAITGSSLLTVVPGLQDPAGHDELPRSGPCAPDCYRAWQ